MTPNHDNDTLEQARMLHDTIRKLRRTVGTLVMSAADMPNVDLTVTQINVMMVVHAHQPVTMKRLAEELGVAPASASAMVDRLVELGALRREQSKVDRRQVEITVSDVAAAAMGQCEQHILGFLQDMLERIGPELAQQWCAVYERLSEILDEDPNIAKGAGGSEARKESPNSLPANQRQSSGRQG